MTKTEILKKLKTLGSKRNVEGMARYGIVSKHAYGVSAAPLYRLAKRIGKDHALALQLWKTQIFDARILATLIDDPARVTESQMERWARQFDNWAICDSCCGRLFRLTPFAYSKAVSWTRRKEEFVKRAGYVLIAVLAVHDKSAPDSRFERMIPLIRRGAKDERNMVKKGVNWALRQIGKRNMRLNRSAIRAAREISSMSGSAPRWVASDALRELTSRSVIQRLRKKAGKRRK